MESPRSPKRRRILASINPPEPRTKDGAPEAPRRDSTMARAYSAPPSDESRAKADGTDNKSPELRDDGGHLPRPTKLRFKSKSRRREEQQEEDDYDDEKDRRHHHRRSHRHDHNHRYRHRDWSRTRSRSRDNERRDRHMEDDDNNTREERQERHRRRHHHHHHRRRHRHKHRSAERKQEQQEEEEDDPFQDPPLSPDTAFRQSLFDAMADDEGAAYWEAVYGQPIHIYGPPPGSGSGGGDGMLEQMTDEEYAAYVRQKMWEKTHEGLLEARARRERERERQAREEEERRAVQRELDRCLRRGEERRRRRAWRRRWETYLRRWREWEEEGKKMGKEQGEGEGEGEGPAARRPAIPCWPIAAANDDDGGILEGEDGSGVGEIHGEAVREFFVKGIGIDEVGEEFAARLKEERVRWHPDKVQQRLGGKVDDRIMRSVTAVFQVIDDLWNDTRKQQGR